MNESTTPPSEEETLASSEGQTEVGDELTALRAQLEGEHQRAEQYLANWQRAAADFQNYRRRTEHERTEAVRMANAMLIINLLPVLDDLERAFDSVSTKLAGLTWVDGIRLIYRKLQATLEAHGLSEIKAVGEDFDPNLHEAVMGVDGEEGKVIEELQKGYRLYDRVIRPAMVKVGRGTPPPEKETAPKPPQEEPG